MSQPKVKSSARSSMPRRNAASVEEPLAGLTEGLGEALGGLVGALGGLAGGLGKTVGGLAQTVSGTLEGLLGQLVGPLQQLQQQARSGDEEAGQAYDQAVSMLQRSSRKGNGDAQELLRQLGEALDASEGGSRENAA